ncbi:MAG: excinuclease ABC subunit UvrC [Kiritimatiellia bacterium]|nr:excinuclease ABC subunit UvrC [Kiritimatiellia bacterium]
MSAICSSTRESDSTDAMTLEEKLAALPDRPGCYLYRDRAGRIIYVGKAVSLRKRVQSYFRPSTLRKAPPKLRSLIHHVADLETIVVRNEAEALLTEASLIKRYRPRFNILMKDDKNYPLLRCRLDERFPRLEFCRLRREDGAEYFGPFPSDGVVRTAARFLQRRFGLRVCKVARPDAETYAHCHDDVLRHCSAPCIGKVSEEAYGAHLEEALEALRGNAPALLEELKGEMAKAAGKEDFEQAARWRDAWMALAELGKRRRLGRQVSFARRAADALEGCRELGEAIGLKVVPRRIECFDISTLFGTCTVSSQVCAIDGLPDRRRYRRFRIRTVEGIDDPRSMAETLSRRYREGRDLPDLVIVDGGITQLRAARKVLSEMGVSIPTVGLAKRLEELVVDDGREPILLPRDSEALKVIMRIRDEAHRFAITYNRTLRNRAIRASVLDEIEGIGAAKKRLLLQRFGSAARLAKASEAELVALPGITPALAKAILERLNPR